MKTKLDLIFCDDCGEEVDAKETQEIKFLIGTELVASIRVCEECADRQQVNFDELKDVDPT